MGAGAPPERAEPLRDAVARGEDSVPLLGRYHCLPRQLETDYDLGSVSLGEGCSGAVLAARCRHSGARVAVKRLSLQGLSAEERGSVACEVELSLSMDHPHVVQLMDVYESDCSVSLVMERLSGGELFSRLVKQGRFSEDQAARTARQMLLALNYLHARGVVHRDVKPENFLYAAEGSDLLKLIDFGLSCRFQPDEVMAAKLGSVDYVAPEVLTARYRGGSCDCWSLGVTIFCLLAGQFPFNGRSQWELLQAITGGKYTMEGPPWAQVSENARSFVRQLLVVDPSLRLTAEKALEHPWLASLSGSGKITKELEAFCLASVATSFVRRPPLQRACLRLVARSLPLETRSALQTEFLALDSSNTGVIELASLVEMLAGLNVTMDTYKASAQALAVLDADGDGFITYSDFLAAMVSVEDVGCDRLVEESFRRLAGDCGSGLEEALVGRFEEASAGSLGQHQGSPVVGARAARVEQQALAREMARRSGWLAALARRVLCIGSAFMSCMS